MKKTKPRGASVRRKLKLKKLKIYGPNGVEELSGLVDTGATFTKVPLHIGEKLGLKAQGGG